MARKGEATPKDAAEEDEYGTGKVLPRRVRIAIAEALEAFKKERDLNNRELSELSEIDGATLSKIMNLDYSPGGPTLLRLRTLLKKSIDEIMGLEPLATPAPAISAADPDFAREVLKVVSSKKQSSRPPPPIPLEEGPPPVAPPPSRRTAKRRRAAP